jgi:hypothetical protein
MKKRDMVREGIVEDEDKFSWWKNMTVRGIIQNSERAHRSMTTERGSL